MAGSATAVYFVKNTQGEMPISTLENYQTKLDVLFGSTPTCGAEDPTIPVIDVWQTQKPMSVDHFQTWWTKLDRPEILIDPSQSHYDEWLEHEADATQSVFGMRNSTNNWSGGLSRYCGFGMFNEGYSAFDESGE